jgi:phosphohistidine phosphatase
LYHAGVRRIIDVLAEQDAAFNSIMIVGHNPGFTDFANHLVQDLTHNIPTCGVVSVIIDTDDWDLKTEKKIELATYDYPKNKT